MGTGSSIAWNTPSMLKSAIRFPPASTARASPGAMSLALASLTNSPIAAELARQAYAVRLNGDDIEVELEL